MVKTRRRDYYSRNGQRKIYTQHAIYIWWKMLEQFGIQKLMMLLNAAECYTEDVEVMAEVTILMLN